jgi:hypothetical protein
MSDRQTFDLIVIGSGAAGLSAALRAAELGGHVAVLTAGAVMAGSSPRAQGGVAAALGADDAPALHAADTLSVGAGLNDVQAVDVLTRLGTHSVLGFAGVFEPDLGLEAVSNGEQAALSARVSTIVSSVPALSSWPRVATQRCGAGRPMRPRRAAQACSSRGRQARRWQIWSSFNSTRQR